MTSLRAIVASTPDVIAALRSATVLDRSAPATDEPDESKQVFSYGPKAPCDTDLIDFADREAAFLVNAAELVADDRGEPVRIAGMWRQFGGFGDPIGLRYDDLRPVLFAVELFEGWFDRGWHHDRFEADMRKVRRRTVKRFDWLAAEFSADADEDDEKQDEQLALHIV
ncbi:hypothetical protein SEA_DARDANUS_54 [Gordonia phage Dardanus]|uniref:Uncharacterized protein n=1 Tax=Gordonia phage Dardanus TaxID=2588489 RepID=A0A514CX75_9CAUD|nr:hypothetical protein KDJ58_gp54 [Gordonia phage Dardanus]QDH85091.1 hypothetical protein SEA_DARDANUS_54 [Gordonia phage Dardanus]